MTCQKKLKIIFTGFELFYPFLYRRIGRTGRCGKTGIATTFINRTCSESILLDLKHLLREAKQKIPPVLESLPDPVSNYRDVGGIKGCGYCGGLGHRVTECPKLHTNNKAQHQAIKNIRVVDGAY